MFPEYEVSLGARKKQKIDTVVDLIEKYRLSYVGLKYPHKIGSIYGFSDYCNLYGGRPYLRQELTEFDIKTMYDMGIGYRIPLTTYNISDTEYKEALPFLKKYHRNGNTLIIQDNNFALKIRENFPLYQVEASIIKAIKTIPEMENLLNIYHTIIPHQQSFDFTIDQTQLSQKLIDSLRIYLCFGCIYTCDNYTCYPKFAVKNKKGMVIPEGPFHCKKHIKHIEREINIEKYLKLGITKFKMSLMDPTRCKLC